MWVALFPKQGVLDNIGQVKAASRWDGGIHFSLLLTVDVV